MNEGETIMKQQQQYRQGDVFIISIDEIPATAVKQIELGRIVLEHGEVTGHAHAINEREGVNLLFDGTRKFLEICYGKSAEVTHEEHDTIVLAPGLYEVRRQIAWSALDQMAQLVKD